MSFRNCILAMGAITASALLLGMVNDAIEYRENKKGRGR
jgi:hypothetical protein